MNDINGLVLLIGETQHYFKQQASKQVDVALTLRNCTDFADSVRRIRRN